MSAAEAVLAALEAALRARVAAPKGEAGLPRLALALIGSNDWGTKTEAGRELRTAVTLRVADGQALRLPRLVEAAEAAGLELGGALGGGWRIASCALVRTRLSIEKTMRVAVVEHRFRVMQEN